MSKIAPRPGTDVQRLSRHGVGDTETIGAVLREVLRHPVRRVGRRWNWKSALLSSLLRAGIFFFVNLRAGWRAALGAMLAEFALRAVLSGYCGALTQAFRRATPRWAATLTVMILLPLANHTLELLLHWLRHTPELKASIIASVSFTAISSAFNLYAMRRGALIVGQERQPLRRDLVQLPGLLAGFFRAIFRTVRKLIARGGRSLRSRFPNSGTRRNPRRVWREA
jgi:hypothetical protein